MGKKKYLFQVQLDLVELTNVALRNEYIFVKVRQKNGGKLTYLSPKSEVKDHKVIWNEKISFQCKTQANASTGILSECYLRFSIRKETRLGGTSKLGFVDVNLSEYAGCGKQSVKYLLEGYSSLTRLDNSILKFFIDMQLISGDPLFKRHLTINEELCTPNMQQHGYNQQPPFMSSQQYPYSTASLITNSHTPTTLGVGSTAAIVNFSTPHYVSETLRPTLNLKTPFIDENKLTDSTRVNNDLAVNEIIEQNLRCASSLPTTPRGLSLHDIQ